MPDWQTLLEQSEAVEHFFVLAHLVVQDPPQSTSVSSPFSTWSEQVGACSQGREGSNWAQRDNLRWQNMHSVIRCGLRCTLPTWHSPPVHTPLEQSDAAPHCLASPHLPHVPPQSTSVSAPFLTLSEQVAACRFASLLLWCVWGRGWIGWWGSYLT